MARSLLALPPTDGGPDARRRVQREERLHMRPYEVMVILDPTLEESAAQAVINRSTELLTTRGATVNRVDKWGKRRLAYEIGHRQEGFYVLLEVTSEPAPIDDLDRALRLADDVVRHKVIRMPEKTSGRVLPPSAIEELTPSRGRDRERD
jgi:small subunit ribosomal protein S6